MHAISLSADIQHRSAPLPDRFLIRLLDEPKLSLMGDDDELAQLAGNQAAQ